MYRDAKVYSVERFRIYEQCRIHDDENVVLTWRPPNRDFRDENVMLAPAHCRFDGFEWDDGTTHYTCPWRRRYVLADGRKREWLYGDDHTKTLLVTSPAVAVEREHATQIRLVAAQETEGG